MASRFVNELDAPLPPSSLVTQPGKEHFDIPGVLFSVVGIPSSSRAPSSSQPVPQCESA